jgi:hypothetical protein
MDPYYIYDTFYRYVRQIHINNSSNNFKQMLIIWWVVCELIMSKFGLQANGFTMSRINNMQKYELLLIELGETYGVTGFGQGYPVEVRIILLSLGDLVMFLVLKYCSNMIGGPGVLQNIMNVINGLMNSGADNSLNSALGATAVGASNAPTGNGTVPVVPPPPLGPNANMSSMIGNITSMLSGILNANANSNNTNVGNNNANTGRGSVRRPTYTE